MRAVVLFVLVAAGCTKDHPALTVTTSFPIAMAMGSAASPLDPLRTGVVDFEVVWGSVDNNHGGDADPPGCKSTGLYATSVRTARGDDAAVVQTQILDMIPDWLVHFQICDASGRSSITLEAAIDSVNTSFSCFGLPPSALATDASGYPELTTFTATQCGATILDVVNVVDLTATDFSMDYVTGPEQLP